MPQEPAIVQCDDGLSKPEDYSLNPCVTKSEWILFQCSPVRDIKNQRGSYSEHRSVPGDTSIGKQGDTITSKSVKRVYSLHSISLLILPFALLGSFPAAANPNAAAELERLLHSQIGVPESRPGSLFGFSSRSLHERPWGGRIHESCLSRPNQIERDLQSFDQAFLNAAQTIERCQAQFPGLSPYTSEFFSAMTDVEFHCTQESGLQSGYAGRYLPSRRRIELALETENHLLNQTNDGLVTLIHELFHATPANSHDEHNELQRHYVASNFCESPEEDPLDDRVIWLTALCTGDESYLERLLQRIEACGQERACTQVLRGEYHRSWLDRTPLLSIIRPRFWLPSDGLGEQATQEVCTDLTSHLIDATWCSRHRNQPEIRYSLYQTPEWERFRQEAREKWANLWQGDRFSSQWLELLASPEWQAERSNHPECVERFMSEDGTLDFADLRRLMNEPESTHRWNENQSLIEWTEGIRAAFRESRDLLDRARNSQDPALASLQRDCRSTLRVLRNNMQDLDSRLPLMLHEETEAMRIRDDILGVPTGMGRLEEAFFLEALQSVYNRSPLLGVADEGPNSRANTLFGEEWMSRLHDYFSTHHPQGDRFDCNLISREHLTLMGVIGALGSSTNSSPLHNKTCP